MDYSFYVDLKECLQQIKTIRQRKLMLILFYQELLMNQQYRFNNRTFESQYLQFKHAYLHEIAETKVLEDKYNYMKSLEQRDYLFLNLQESVKK